jgi:hypothetical protein
MYSVSEIYKYIIWKTAFSRKNIYLENHKKASKTVLGRSCIDADIDLLL